MFASKTSPSTSCSKTPLTIPNRSNPLAFSTNKINPPIPSSHVAQSTLTAKAVSSMPSFEATPSTSQSSPAVLHKNDVSAQFTFTTDKTLPYRSFDLSMFASKTSPSTSCSKTPLTIPNRRNPLALSTSDINPSIPFSRVAESVMTAKAASSIPLYTSYQVTPSASSQNSPTMSYNNDGSARSAPTTDTTLPYRSFDLSMFAPKTAPSRSYSSTPSTVPDRNIPLALSSREIDPSIPFSQVARAMVASNMTSSMQSVSASTVMPAVETESAIPPQKGATAVATKRFASSLPTKSMSTSVFPATVAPKMSTSITAPDIPTGGTAPAVPTLRIIPGSPSRRIFHVKPNSFKKASAQRVSRKLVASGDSKESPQNETAEKRCQMHETFFPMLLMSRPNKRART
jgi:hypothetical protein